MRQMQFRSFVLFLAVIVVLAGCAPAASVPDVDPGSSPMPAQASAGQDLGEPVGSPAMPPAPAAPQATPDSATTISGTETSMRLTFATAALAQPVPVGSGQFRVGTIEVSSPAMPVQTLDVVMDQPNSEWAQLPLRTDDMNFDGKPDLVVTQPVGAKWGRLHVWLYDPGANGFFTNTLTAELRQLVVGSYRVDPAKKTLHIANALGMTPFEAVYETAGGHLMPVLPAAAPAAGACPEKAQGMQLLRQEQQGFCLLFPEGFETVQPSENELTIRVPGTIRHGAQAFIKINPAGQKTAEQIGDELMAPFAELTPTAPHQKALLMQRGRGMLDGEPAVMINNLPGQDLGRVVVAVHGGRAYQLTFVPADRVDEAYTLMEALFASVTRSLRFLDPGAGQPAPASAQPGAAEARQLVFTSARSGHLELYAAAAGGSKAPGAGAQAARQLTQSPEWKGSLVAAPDGSRIVFVSETRNADGSPTDREIYLLTLDGSQPINLTRHPAIDFEPAWSPDGKQLAFVSNRGSDRYTNSIYVLDVAAAAAGGGSAAAHLVAANAGAPTWSPDGRQIAFISDRDTPGQAQVYVMDSAGGDPRRLTDGRKTGNGAGVGRPAWSPNGTQLAVPTDREGNREIFLVPLAPGGKPVNLTRDPGYDDSPLWSPDGNRLAFISDRGGRPSPYVADADGQNVHALAPGLTATLGPWSPDSQRLALVVTGEDLNQEIYVVDVGGWGLTAVTDDPAQDTSPVWPGFIVGPSGENTGRSLYEGISLSFPVSVAHSASGESIAAVERGADTPWWLVAPRHREIRPVGYPVARSADPARIVVYPVADFASANPQAAVRIELLRQVLKHQAFEPGAQLPFLPLINAGQVMRARVRFMSFQGGQGISFLTQLGQAPGPINNQELFYTFQGLTNDGAHYVAAILPVTHASLPDNFDRLPETERKAVEDNFAKYTDGAVKALEVQADASFGPSLVDLDAVVQSISITP